MDLSMIINSGLFAPGTEVAFNCPTRNCTFPEVCHSVGYCSSCNDITGDLLVKYGTIPKATTNYTNVSLPGYWSEYFGWTPPVTAVLNFSEYDSNTAYLVMDNANYAVVVSQLNESTVFRSEEISHWGCDPPGYYFGVGAACCSILPCVKSYGASVSAGRLSEEVVSTVNMWIWDYPVGSSVTKATINVACLPKET
jgi:hypothetical protein